MSNLSNALVATAGRSPVSTRAQELVAEDIRAVVTALAVRESALLAAPDLETPAFIGPTTNSLTAGGLEPDTAQAVADWIIAAVRTVQRLPRLRAMIREGHGRADRRERIEQAAEIEAARMRLSQAESDLRRLLSEGRAAMALAALHDRWSWDAAAGYLAHAAGMPRKQLDRLTTDATAKMRILSAGAAPLPVAKQFPHEVEHALRQLPPDRMTAALDHVSRFGIDGAVGRALIRLGNAASRKARETATLHLTGVLASVGTEQATT